MRRDETPLRPIVRGDLEWSKRTVRGKSRWIVRDPLNLEFFYFSDREKSFLQGLDGDRTVQGILGDDPKDAATTSWRRQLLDRTLKAQLVTASAAGRARSLRQKRDSKRARQRRVSLLNLIAVRVPLLDPHRVLTRLRFPLGLIYSKFTLAMLCCLVLGTAVFCIARWEQIVLRLPAMGELFTGERLIWLLGSYIFMKVLHEASHAFACTSVGAECHELGVYFLAFTPCLYCDVTDVWRLPNKYARIMVSAAGIAAEVTVATLAGLVWLATYDGVLNSLCFNLMLLGSVSTLLVNANPLLRYDGYYILADLVDVPNLREQSQEALSAPMMRWIFGDRRNPTPRDAAWFPLAAYGLCSFLYRILVLILIFWGMKELLDGWQLEFLWVILTSTVAAGLLLSIAIRLHRLTWELVMVGIWAWIRLAVLLTAMGTLAFFGLTVPLPSWVQTVGVARPKSMEPVFVLRTGILVSTVASGERVERGDRIAVFRSPEDQLQLQQLSSEIEESSVVLSGLRARLNDEPGLSLQVAELETTLRDKREQLLAIRDDVAQLTVLAHTSGTLLEPAWSPPVEEDSVQLRQWSGSPLAPENVGGHFQQGTLLGWIASDDAWELDAYVPESKIAEIRKGAHVEIQSDRSPFHPLSGITTQIDAQPVERLPSVLAGDPRLPIVGDGASPQLGETCYRVVLEADQLGEAVSLRSLATVRIKTESKPMLRRIIEYVQRQFRT